MKCPYCGSKQITTTPDTKGQLRCYDCRARFDAPRRLLERKS